MDRRDFFKTTLTGAGALALASSPLALVSSCAPKKKGADTKLHLSFQHGTPPGETLAEKFDYMEKLGIEGYEPGGQYLLHDNLSMTPSTELVKQVVEACDMPGKFEEYKAMVPDILATPSRSLPSARASRGSSWRKTRL